MIPIDYARAIYDPSGNPLDYPGRIVSAPLLVTDGGYCPLTHARDFSLFRLDDGRTVDDVLATRGEAPLSQRVAQIAFGANRNLENIAWKFRNYHAADHSISQDFVALPAVIRNADVVACNIGYWGYVYGGLLTATASCGFRDYLLGSACPVTLLLLDESQMKAVHKSEGVPLPGEAPHGVACGVSDVEVSLSATVTCRAQVYSLSVPFLSFDGQRPVAFDAVATRGRNGYPALRQDEMFARINALLQAEAPRPGRVPIAQTLHARALDLLRQGAHATRAMTHDPLFATTRRALAEAYVLRDADGQVRTGLDGVHPIRSPADAWRFSPSFAPS